MERAKQTHPFPPLYDAASRVLILGSFPSVKSREQRFFYGHPQNRFWRVLPALFGEAAPTTVEEKKALVLRNRLALWDTIASCEIVGSSDASITNVVANDLRPILDGADIRAIFCNGGTSYRWYNKLLRDGLGREAALLPSTSPANAQWTLERLTAAWRAAILPYLE
ncbi:MAG: DNA-deoxyinosine glycosylase [Oscillospiraceae bacterium]|nr:DNA-deoxyinosine glycosylase [Oscillospiraceae bacterium]